MMNKMLKIRAVQRITVWNEAVEFFESFVEFWSAIFYSPEITSISRQDTHEGLLTVSNRM